MSDGNLSKEEILAAIKECAEKLGHPPSFPELKNMMDVGMRRLRRFFGSYSNALSEAGLRPRRNAQMPLERLFEDWARVTRDLRKIPTLSEYEAMGEYSSRPLLTRFRRLLNVPRALYQYANGTRLKADWADVLEIIRTSNDLVPGEELMAVPTTGTPTSTADESGAMALILDNRPLYGAVLHLPGMAHAPMNEAGVLCLFGMLAAELGFIILRVQSEFPDCEALRKVGQGRCQRVWIEFEFESRNFQLHMHDERQCDLIVCWKHNWPDCPLPVLELQPIVEKMGFRG